ncbi:unnamed protein product [Acanthosepion pharaonis]|uniref:EF-hand domain-containing protein n=1 Tax=Acanthosepion pharaonis TaxID=158019 RepID=A0A812D476_ACAPH|nr:unnamed protein product [Sepia pharaonis]
MLSHYIVLLATILFPHISNNLSILYYSITLHCSSRYHPLSSHIFRVSVSRHRRKDFTLSITRNFKRFWFNLMKNIKILAILALFLVAVRTDEEVLEEEVDPLVNMLQSMKSMSKFRRDVDSFFRPLLKNIENKDRREEDVTDFLFAMFDHNNDGFIDSGEMHFLFKEMGATSTERKQILRYIDRDRDNRLNKDELRNIWRYAS